LTMTVHGIAAWAENPLATQSEVYQQLAQWGLPVSQDTRVLHSLTEVEDYVQEYQQQRTTSEHEIDDEVIKGDDFSQRGALGISSRMPRQAIAYRCPPEKVHRTLLDSKIVIGPPGRATPYAVVQVLKAGGSTA